MKKKSLMKNTGREILQSKARFFSILILIMLGVAFFTGLKAVGPDMLLTAEKNYDKYKLADLEVMSTYGLDESDEELLKGAEGVKDVQFGYSADVILKDSNLVTKVYSKSEAKDVLNDYQIEKGRLPEKSGEIAVDQKLSYQIGDQISFVQNDGTEFTDTFSKTSFTVVGVVSSPKYIENTKRGSSLIGNGEVGGFAVISEKDFNMDVYSVAYLTFDNTEKLAAYSTEYEAVNEENLEAIESLLEKQPQKRLNEIKEEAQLEINQGESEIQDSKDALVRTEEQLSEAKRQIDQAKEQYRQSETLLYQQLAEAEEQIQQKEKELQALQALVGNEDAIEDTYNEGQRQIEEAWAQFEANKERGLSQLAEAKRQIEENEQKYEENLALFQREKQDADSKIAEAELELADAKEKLAQLELPKYYVLDRTSYPGYVEFQQNADRLNSLSTVFPVIFFLVAVLVCLTTMTRMVEEQRTQIGLMKALGYRNGDIISKFLIYGSLASILGAAAGLVIGFELLPRIIVNAYSVMYNIPSLEIVYYPELIVIATVIGLLCTSVTAVVVTRTELRENAAGLMRPKAPKNGQRILLERCYFIWKRLNFTSKVTARNIFRYKQRMFMTIFGVAGCTALIFIGFGLRGSINDLVPLQFGEIMNYDAMVVTDSNADEESQNYNELLKETEQITGQTSIAQYSMTAKKKGQANHDVTVVVPKNVEEYSTFMNLRNRKSGEAQKITEDGAIISEKLAKLLDLDIGDKFTINNQENNPFTIKVSGITEMYVGHYAYMTSDYYRAVFNEEASYNTDLLQLKDTSKSWEDAFAETLMQNNTVVAVTYLNTISGLLADTMGSLDIVVVVLITCAGLLAFVVLYNLTNINVSERIRELSTIKVLGFYPKEVTMYVYRENIFLTLIGIVFGYGLGLFLHRFVIKTAELDELMISPAIHATSYVYSGVLTILFAAIVMFFMHMKLKKIDMIEALKSIE